MSDKIKYADTIALLDKIIEADDRHKKALRQDVDYRVQAAQTGDVGAARAAGECALAARQAHLDRDNLILQLIPTYRRDKR